MEITAKYRPNLQITEDSESLASKTVDIFVDQADKAISKRGFFYVAISGGNTPKRFFELLSESPPSRQLAWDKIHIFWVDERYVPQDSPASNYKLARDTFLTKINIPGSNVHPIPTEHDDFSLSAKLYEQELRNAFQLGANQFPEFDLIVLGMGPDGHTGSLMPNSYAMFDTNDLACVVYVLDEKLNRITLTHPVLCASKHLVVLISGGEKADILKEVFTSEPDDVNYPIHTLWPVLDKVTWLLDKDAARYL